MIPGHILLGYVLGLGVGWAFVIGMWGEAHNDFMLIVLGTLFGVLGAYIAKKLGDVWNAAE